MFKEVNIKIIGAALLACLLMFNWFGYRWAISLMQQDQDAQLETKLDKQDYKESDLIEISIPVNLPYQTDWAGFERYDGAIEVNGIYYKYVARKIQDGRLVLKCIRNAARQQLESVNDALFKMTNDLQPDNAQKKPGSPAVQIFKKTLGDYDSLQQPGIALFAVITPHYLSAHQAASKSAGFYLIPEQPPKA